MTRDFLNEHIDTLYKQASYINSAREEYEMLKQAGWIGPVARSVWTGGKYLLKAPFRETVQPLRWAWSKLGKGFNRVTGKKLIGADKANRAYKRTLARERRDLDNILGKDLNRSHGLGGKLARGVVGTAGFASSAALPAAATYAITPYANTAIEKLPAGAQDAIANPGAAALEWYAEPRLREMAQITANMGPGWHTKLAISPDAAYKELEDKLKSHFWAPGTGTMIDEYMQGLRQSGGRMHGVAGLVTPGWTAKQIENTAVNTLRRKTDAMRVAAGGKAKYDSKELSSTQNLTASDLAPFGIAAGGLGLLALNNWINSDDDEGGAPAAGGVTGGVAGGARGSQQSGVSYSNRYKKLYGRNFDELEAPDGDVRDLDYSRPV